MNPDGQDIVWGSDDSAVEAAAFWLGMWEVVKFVALPLRLGWGTLVLVKRWLETRLHKKQVAIATADNLTEPPSLS